MKPESIQTNIQTAFQFISVFRMKLPSRLKNNNNSDIFYILLLSRKEVFLYYLIISQHEIKTTQLFKFDFQAIS